MQHGIFITFEGGEGAGKSTQIKRLSERLVDVGYDVVVTREPGGSEGAEAVRHVLLSGAAQPFGVGMEVLLFAAARNDHIEEIIRPALLAGKIVLCDRFMDSSRVYQGAAGGLSPQFVSTVERIAVDDVLPDLTLVFDLDAMTGLERVHSRSSLAKTAEAEPDRFEKDDIAVHEQRRKAYLEIARNEPGRCRIINASQDQELVADAVWAAVRPVLERASQDGAD